MSAWKTGTLSEVVSIVGGGTPTRSNPDYYGGTIPWVTPKDMKSWEIVGAQITLTQAGVDNSATRVVPQNSILIVVRSGVLKHTIPVGLNRVPVAINQDMKALQCRDGIDADFLARFIKAQSPVILQWVRATTADNFPIDKLKKLPVPLPPLAEQRRIAEVLDRAEALRAKRRAALAQLDSLTQSLFLDLFGDPARNTKRLPTTSLGNLGEWSSGGTPPRSRADYFDGAIPWFSSGELNTMFVNESEEHVSTEALYETTAKTVPKGALMLGMYDTAALKASIAGVECSCNQAIAFATIDSAIAETVFVYFAILIGREHFRRLQRGIRQKNLNLTMVREISIPRPPLKQQQEFARQVTAIEKLKVSHQVSLEALDALFTSLQQRAFHGKLAIQDTLHKSLPDNRPGKR